MERLSKEGFQLLNPEPKLGADNKWVCFLHPRDTHGVLIELCQERESQRFPVAPTLTIFPTLILI